VIVSNNNGTLSDPFPSGSYFGVINFEKSPIVLGEETDNGGVVLQ
jgi:hypothetical protein